MGLYNEAIPLLQESLAISKKYFGEDMVYAFDLHQLAEVYEYLGEYDKALPLYQKALPIQKKNGGNNYYYPRTLSSIASLFTKLGQYDKAIHYFILSLEIKKDYFGEVSPEYTTTLNSYAKACLLKGDYKKALSLQMQSLQLNKKLFGETHPNIATGLYNLAALYYKQHNIQKAEEVCSQSLKMQKKIFGERHPDIATSYDLLGNIYEQMYHYNTALDYYQHAFETRKNIMTAAHPDYINSLYNLGRMYIKKGRIQEAAQLLMEADSTALLHIQQSYTTLSEEEKSVYLHNSEEKFQYLPSLLYLHKTRSPEIVNRVYSNTLVLKSMVLFHQQQVYNSIRKSGDSSALNLYNLWRFNKTLLGRQILLPEENGILILTVWMMLLQNGRTAITYFSSFSSNTLYNAANIKEIVQQLSKDEAAIEFIRFRLFNNNWTDSIIYAALILLPGKNNAVFVPLFEEKLLKKILRFSKNTGEAAINYLYPAIDKETAVSLELYRLVWQPLQPLLDSIYTVYYSPCGLLCKLSFAALHAGKGRMLADKYNLKQLLCTRSLALPQENKSNFTTASLWGNIDYNNAANSNENSLHGYDSVDSILFTPAYDISKLNKNYFTGLLPSLPGTKTETENIFLLLKEKDIACKLENKSAANEEQFKKMDGISPDLLHIATHGFFLPTVATIKTNNYYSYENNSFSLQQNPMLRSGLLMAGANAAWSGKTTHTNAEDGVLTAYEIAQLDLSNTKLVTLSACETALGNIENNEGVYGLQRAFKMAGAKQVLMSLWKIPDKETSVLMLLFYSSLLKSNDPGTALRHAQLVMKEKYPPYYWAGFVLSE
jgi:CHAT domain-containing protein